MELIKVGENTYYIKNPVNIGVYKINEEEVYLIDTGNDADSGKKILKIMQENNFKVKGIINTHSHADHCGGNKVIQDRENSSIYSYGIEKYFIKNPILEPAFLYGSYPFKNLQNKFLMAKESKVEDISLVKDLEYFPLKGHSFDMIGIKTKDDVYFLGDALVGKEQIDKYSLFYLVNVEDYLNTLNYLETLKGKLFICSHIEATSDIRNLIKINREKIEEILALVCDYCSNNITFEDLLQQIFTHYNLTMNTNQYVLLSSTLKAYLTYLIDKKIIDYTFIDNKMYYYKV